MGSRNLLKHGLEKNPVHNSFPFVLSISSPGICFRKRAWGSTLCFHQRHRSNTEDMFS